MPQEAQLPCGGIDSRAVERGGEHVDSSHPVTRTAEGPEGVSDTEQPGSGPECTAIGRDPNHPRSVPHPRRAAPRTGPVLRCGRRW